MFEVEARIYYYTEVAYRWLRLDFAVTNLKLNRFKFFSAGYKLCACVCVCICAHVCACAYVHVCVRVHICACVCESVYNVYYTMFCGIKIFQDQISMIYVYFMYRYYLFPSTSENYKYLSIFFEHSRIIVIFLI